MADRIDQRSAIASALGAFTDRPFPEAAANLFNALGYASERRLPISTVSQFLDSLDPNAKLTAREREGLQSLGSLHFLFQLTDAELTAQLDLFDDRSAVETAQIQSYVFLAAELPSGHYTRTALSTLVRAVNKPLPMPAIVLFRHDDSVSVGIIHRRIHKRDQGRDVLEKVTLIKDIACTDPIRAHLEILNDFALGNLDADFRVSDFVGLHEAWQKRLGSYALSNDFYREIADWYFWAQHLIQDGQIVLPQHCDTEQEQSLFLIRLLTRVIFCWFLVEKRLIPASLFREHSIRSLLNEFNPSKDPKKPDKAGTYYHAVLQNLFFGTLNMPVDQRAFRQKKKADERYDKNYGITNLWRYESDFRDAKDWLALAARIPFLNGGLFDCLDDKTGKRKDNFILDGFSDNPRLCCHLPNDLFFGPERNVDLSKDYGEETKKTARSKKAKVRGLIEILSRYKFTIEENTPLEEEIALDPELLGKVFENLLASYNEDTRTTARKALGAFYTPREIVSYMVDEALKSHLSTQVPRCKGALEDLFSNKATLKEIKPDTRDALIAAIGRVKILDPACGSGAFPMGALHRLVDLLQKLDPDNVKWREIQRLRAVAETEEAFKSGDRESREQRLKEINDTFEFNSSDYGRKLYLIENSIYGVDIQPIATQIAKLRFFISLVVEQKVTPSAPNFGVLPLPNLETRIVAADTLIPIEKSERDLFSTELDRLRAELAAIRHQHFNARSPAVKRKWREADAAKRQEIADYLDREHTIPPESARKLAAWDPYDQNTFAPFFDSEWMFGLPVGRVTVRKQSTGTIRGKFTFVNDLPGQKELVAETSQQIDTGFDIVIGNPPYVRMEEIKDYKPLFRKIYKCFSGRADLYVYFFEAAFNLLSLNGVLSFITSNKYFRAAYGPALRQLLATRCRIRSLVDFGDAPVFTAIAYPAIIVAQRLAEDQTLPSDARTRAMSWTPGPPIERFAEILASKCINLPQSSLIADAWRIEDDTTARILSSLRATGMPLAEYAEERIFRGVVTGLNDAFVIDSPTRRHLIAEDNRAAEIIKPFLRGRDVKRWNAVSSDQWLIYTRKGIDIRRYPSIVKYMRPFKEALEGRATQQEWYELQQPQYAYAPAFESPKIIYPDIYEHQSFAWDESGSYLANTCYFLPIAQKWLLGLLNSQAVEWFYAMVSNSVRGGYLRAFTDYVRQIPIPTTTATQRGSMTLLVDSVLCLNAYVLTPHNDETRRDEVARAALMLSYWERVLNGLVYELYFREEVHGAGLRLFDLVEEAKLPDINTIPEAERLRTLREKFEDLSDSQHPLRIALDKLQTLDTVRIIEGKT